MTTTTTTSPAYFNADASDLGLAPGIWPKVVKYGVTYWTAVSRKRDADGDTVYVRYVSPAGHSLLVHND